MQVILRTLSHDDYREEIEWMFYGEVALVQLFLKLAGYFLYLVYRLVWRHASDTASTATCGGSTTNGGSRASTDSGSSGASVATPATVNSDSAVIRLESKVSVA